jgi:hypothetical protein
MAHARAFTLFCLLWVLLFPVEAAAQYHKISGRIVDAETLEPLPYAHVFIDQTTIGAVSDFNGEYVIEHISNGDYKLVFSFVGYELFYKVASVNGKDARVSARLIPQKELLQNVEVKGTRDKQWESQLRQFNRVFFGENQFADGCKILNPWVLDFEYDKPIKKFKAVASAPIEIENRALGYTIVCNLQGFTFDKDSYKIKGLYKFEEINTLDAREAVRWTRNRRQAYQNSLRFLMKSVVEQHASENGFSLYLDNRPAIYTSHTGLFSVELDKENVTPLKLEDRVKPSGRPGFYLINFDKRIEVHHTTQFARTKTYRDIPNPVSWIEVEKKEPLLVSEEGFILNNDLVVTSGELNMNRISSMLPLNYSPGNFVVVNYLTKRNIAKRLQERAFVQTDKSIYYPGENIWVKVHMNYANQSVRDSLSQVLYVDLLDNLADIVQSKILKIDSTGAYGEFFIGPDSKPGKYYVRAYTRWMQNYGSGVVSYIPIIISNNQQKLVMVKDGANVDAEDFVWNIQPDSQDSISLFLALDSTLHLDNAPCAISIAPIGSGSTNYLKLVKKSLFFDEDLPDGSLPDFVYPLEYGFSVNGKIIHPKKQYVQANMTVIRGKMDSLYNFRTDRKGQFTIEDLNYFDSTSFSFQARDKKGRIFAKTEVQPIQRPAVRLPNNEKPAELDTVLFFQALSLVAPKLDTVKLDKPSEESAPLNLGNQADYVLTEEDLESMPGGLSIVNALQGRIPGLQFSPSGKSLSFSGNKFGKSENTEPLFVIDGVPVFTQHASKAQRDDATQQRQSQQDIANKEAPGNTQEVQGLRQNQNLMNNVSQPSQELGGGNTLDMISYITVSGVSRVEVMSRMDPKYGSMGENGVIAIYTKKVQGKGSAVKTFDVYNIHGFSKAQKFKQAINYVNSSTADYTPTWFWNPDILISSKQFSQIKIPTLPKGVIFKVTVAGVTKSGEPVTGSFLLNSGGTKPLSASLDQRQK